MLAAFSPRANAQAVTIVPMVVGVAANESVKTTSTPTFWSSASALQQSVEFDSSSYSQMRIVVNYVCAFNLHADVTSNGTTSLVARCLPYVGGATDTVFVDYHMAADYSLDIQVNIGTTDGATYCGPWLNLQPAGIGDNIWVVGIQDSANAGLYNLVSSILLEFR